MFVLLLYALVRKEANKAWIELQIIVKLLSIGYLRYLQNQIKTVYNFGILYGHHFMC